MLRNLVCVAAACVAAVIVATAAGAQDSDPWFSRISDQAKALAGQPYKAPAEISTQPLKDLNHDRYGQIRFRKDHALWRGQGRFAVEFFHPGFLYLQPVKINVVEGDEVWPLGFDAAMFDYGNSGIAGALAPDTGFAGFRVHYPLNRADYQDEVISFLGASQFRVLGRGQAYGLSARGLAVNTALPTGEEFPSFREFWLLKPAADAASLRIYALVDSKSVAGAYRFDVAPGRDTAVDVRTDLFVRADIQRLGVAPLSSMFLHGPDPKFDDYRPEVHDSDGLVLQSATGEWTWRPLTNPGTLRVSSFMDRNVLGFGLLQRDRDFASYLDLDAAFERRPGLWIEPQGGGWQDGATYLVEIPVKEEIHDNIISFWSPPGPVKAGSQLSYQYRLRTVGASLTALPLARVVNSSIGWAAVPGAENPPPRTVRRVMIGFRGGGLTGLDGSFPVAASISASSGTIKEPSVRKRPAEDIWWASFQLTPDGDKPSDVRLFLTLDGKRLSETWNYVYDPKDRG